MISPLTTFDVLAQLRRRWSLVVGGAFAGLVTGIAIGTPSPSAALLGGAALTGAIVGFAVAFVLVKLHPRVTTVADIRRVTGLPVVAQLPSATIDSDDFGDHPLSRRMRTTLREAVMNTQVLAGGRLPRRLVLARTDSVDEASGVDGGLARALVESGHATALLHSDLESRLEARPGTVPPSFVADEAPRFDPSGYQREPVPDRVASARADDRLARVDQALTSLGERYDVTVAQASSNSLPLALRDIAPAGDATLLVARSNRTTVESLLSVYGELLSLGVEPLGVILTGVAARHRVLLRTTWSPTDFRSSGRPSLATLPAPDPADVVAPAVTAPFSFEADSAAPDADVHPATRLAGFSIADLVTRSAPDAPEENS